MADDYSFDDRDAAIDRYLETTLEDLTIDVDHEQAGVSAVKTVEPVDRCMESSDGIFSPTISIRRTIWDRRCSMPTRPSTTGFVASSTSTSNRAILNGTNP